MSDLYSQRNDEAHRCRVTLGSWLGDKSDAPDALHNLRGWIGQVVLIVEWSFRVVVVRSACRDVGLGRTKVLVVDMSAGYVESSTISGERQYVASRRGEFIETSLLPLLGLFGSARGRRHDR